VARISSAVIEDITQLNIADIVSPHVELTRAGRNMRGLCPFHSEKTPSFNVHEDKGIFKCFGCNEAGDGITFIMKYLNLDYVDAVSYICENFGIELRYDDSGPVKPTKDLKDLHEAVLEYASKELFSDTGKRALDYLYGRGFERPLIESFNLGYLSPQVSISRFEKHFSQTVLKESGIFTGSGNDMRCFFADRIIFPIHNRSGSCVGFSGRTMNPEEKAKYKNSPETAIFFKRRELFNLHRAKDAMTASKRCYIAEGYFDVMRMVAAGYTETVAIMGTAFTKEQVTLLKRHCEEYNLILDGDQAGQKAMRDSRAVAIEANIYPNVIFLPEGEDPDTYIKGKGVDAFAKIVDTKEDLLTYTIKLARRDATDDNKRFNRLEQIKSMLQTLRDPYRRDHYAAQAAEIFGVSLDMLSADVNATSRSKKPIVEHVSKKSSTINICEKNLVSCLLQLSEEEIYSIVDGLGPAYFEDKTMQTIFNKIVELSEKNANINVLLNDPELGQITAELIIRDSACEDVYAEAVNNKYQVQLNYYENARRANARQLSQITNEDEKMKLFMEGQKLLGIVRELKSKIS
jgi:DNA primase